MTAHRKQNPSKQGELDGACGFYAITNLIAYLEPELSSEEIFRIVLQSFLYDGNPMRFVHGTNRGSIKNTLSRTLDTLHNEFVFADNKTGQSYEWRFRIPYWQSQPKNRQEVLDHIQESSHESGCASIIGYEYNDGVNYNAHWTVITGLRNEKLFTFDSSGEQKTIPLSQVRIDAAPRSSHIARPYNICSRDLFTIWKQS